jgi:hypothetical protein
MWLCMGVMTKMQNCMLEDTEAVAPAGSGRQTVPLEDGDDRG